LLAASWGEGRTHDSSGGPSGDPDTPPSRETGCHPEMGLAGESWNCLACCRFWARTLRATWGSKSIGASPDCHAARTRACARGNDRPRRGGAWTHVPVRGRLGL